MTVYACYRVLYGEDFLRESVESIIDSTDKVFIFWTDTPRGDPKKVLYKGESIQLSYPFDGVKGIVEQLAAKYPSKVEVIYDKGLTDINQFTHWMNDIILPNYKRPDTACLVEYDHIYHRGDFNKAIQLFKKSGLTCASTHPVEHWVEPRYIVPPRPSRLCTMFWNMNRTEVIPPTSRHANLERTDFVDFWTHNFGFCISPENMFWKHLLCIASSAITGDSKPREDWYDKWLNWQEGDRNLDVSIGAESSIPYAMPFDVGQLPEIIREKYGYS